MMYPPTEHENKRWELIIAPLSDQVCPGSKFDQQINIALVIAFSSRNGYKDTDLPNIITGSKFFFTAFQPGHYFNGGLSSGSYKTIE